uniref:Uncharacterized protein n=1 Tax=Anguilla anguilla TaxID=7936 RepID=A0A0E9R844_ANGAN
MRRMKTTATIMARATVMATFIIHPKTMAVKRNEDSAEA